MCALCRSQSLPPARPYATWTLASLLAAILLIPGAVLAWRAFSRTEHTVIAQESMPGRGGTERSERALSAVAVSEPAPPAEAEPHRGESVPFDQPVPTPVVPAVETARASSAPPSATSAPAAPPPHSQRPAPTPAELQAALAATPIVMYSASWCTVCRKARQFLTENGLRFRDIDVDQTPGAWETVERQSGQRAVPLIIVDGQSFSGLNPNGIMRAVASSMERRLGITGIRFQKT